MQRRKFILGLGATTAGGASLIGSGAFTSVEANRNVSVEVADDSDAFLALISTSEYATDEDGTFSLDLSPADPTDAGGKGVNANATTFIGDAFKIENQGTKTVKLRFDGDNGNSGRRIELGEVRSDGIAVDVFPDDGDNPENIEPGDDVSYDVEIEVDEDPDVETIDETITVIAEPADD